MASDDDQAASTTKKATGQRQPAKRSTSKKAAKSTAKKSATAKSARTRSGSGGRASAPQAASRPKLGATEIARSAIVEVAGMTGHDIESITSLERTDEGCTVQVQAVEL